MVIPALFVIPSLVLFIYLIYETAKLSAEKIKHQFALDTAVFVEMTNYSDFLNRTAYVNGAFPARVCYEAFSDPELTVDPIEGYSGQPMGLYEYLKNAGLCPYSPKCSKPDKCSELAQESTSDWGFTYNETPCSVGGNCTEGRATYDLDPKRAIFLFDKVFATTHHLLFPMVEFLMQNYNIIFSLLGVVEESQIAVFSRLTAGHYFYGRAYTMNVPGEKATSAGQLPKIFPHSAYIDQVNSWLNVIDQHQTYQTVAIGPQPMHLLVLTKVAGLGTGQSIPPREIKQTWKTDANYFKVDANRTLGYQPYVHATVEVSGGNVWPGATPRYQVRLYP